MKNTKYMTFLGIYFSFVILLTSCSGGDEAPMVATESHVPVTAQTVPPLGDYAFFETEDAEWVGDSFGFATSPEEGGIASHIISPNESSRMLVYTVDTTLQTTGFMHGMRLLLNEVNSSGGFVEYANIRGSDMRFPATERNANFTFRIPSENLTDFLVLIEDNFNILRFNQTSRNITFRYHRMNLELDNLLERQERLIEELENEENSSRRAQIERNLTEVGRAITDNVVSYNILEDEFLYSTIHVNLQEVFIREPEEPKPPLTFGQEILVALSQALDVLGLVLRGLIIVLAALLPFLVLAAIVFFIVIIILKKYRKAKEEKSKIEVVEAKEEQVKEEKN
ncbi:MAG: DUF4349 domain-containing protein [Defluviitaleaceae bacterium]|nr:DUF4349 domain-containing protein [Defluviitaleaceae bacterium]